MYHPTIFFDLWASLENNPSKIHPIIAITQKCACQVQNITANSYCIGTHEVLLKPCNACWPVFGTLVTKFVTKED